MEADAPKTGRPSMCGSCGNCKRCERAAYMKQWWANLSPDANGNATTAPAGSKRTTRITRDRVT